MKLICVGRNYSEHARELNNAVPEEPLIFFKPDTAVLRDNKDFYYPEFTQNLHFECELVFRIGKEARHIPESFVYSYLDGVGLGIDMTARDIQDQVKAKGWPWTLAKGFDHSAPVSAFIDPAQFSDLQQLRFRCAINGETRQQGHAADMIFSIPQLIAYISRFITLKKGDLVFTGTPAGVGPLKIGDHVEAWLEDQQMMSFHVK
ncbi:MAG: fumarylacetoacetate hydrolase family protein [Bacteroidia bacterium]|nr:fumarylacetoacetate hydrolase family protein [Bacteroidia bacterium]